MTDRTKNWAEMAADCAIDAANATDHDDAMQWIGLSVANALLAIHDTLTAADRYAANEERQREAEPDPLDEDDHRDRLTGSGHRLRRWAIGCWHTKLAGHGSPACDTTLGYWDDQDGPLTFAPKAAQEATDGDLSASEGESGDEEGGEADDAHKAILCPECGDHINTHNMEGCRFILCDCPHTPEDIARALIDRAVKAERGRIVDDLKRLSQGVAGISRVELMAMFERWEAR